MTFWAWAESKLREHSYRIESEPAAIFFIIITLGRMIKIVIRFNKCTDKNSKNESVIFCIIKLLIQNIYL